MTAGRWLVRRAGCSRLLGREGGQALTWTRKLSRQAVTLFLFSDLLVVAREKGRGSWVVVDHCCRNLAELSPGLQQQGAGLASPGAALLTLLQVHRTHYCPVILFCSELG